MSDSTVYNLLRGTEDWSGDWQNASYWYKSGTHDGFAVMRRNDAWKGLYKPVALTAGTTYTFSAMVRVPAGKNAHIYLASGGTVNDTYLANSEFSGVQGSVVTGDGGWFEISHTFTPTASKAVKARIEADDSYTIEVCALMLVEGTEPAAWAPAEGEELSGGGASMRANLLEGVTPTLMSGTTESDGVWHNAGRTSTDGHQDWLVWDLAGQSALATNQTYHFGLSTRGASANASSLRPTIGYMDAAGHKNWAVPNACAVGTSWTRDEATIVIPSGMTPFAFYVAAYGVCPETWMAAPTLSLGSPVPLASSAHTPYATQDHLRSEYATKAALKVTSDAVTAEVTERGRLAGRVGTLESTSGTHTSRLEQLAASIKSLVKGESTYTDPDGKSATSGIYSLVTQTRDSVTALFGQYTKTADLASTAAVKDAKKAGTDAASAASAAASAASAAQSTANTAKSAASAAQSTADTAKANAATAQSTANTAVTNASKAQSTADAAKGTADGLATMIREDATGITVGKSADGKTYSTGRTRMTDSAFEVLDKAGATVTQLAADGASFLSGLVRIVAGKATLPGNLKVNSITIDSGGGVAVLRGIVSSISANLNGVTSSVSAGWEQDFGHGVTAIVREDAHLEPGKMVPERMASTHLASDKAELHVGDNSVKVTGDGFSLSHPEYLRKGLRITQGSKICHGHGTAWVTLFESWAEFQSQTGCYDSARLPTLVTMNGDYGAFDGALSDCEIKGGEAVYVMARTTDGPHTLGSSNSVRINWICIW